MLDIKKVYTNRYIKELRLMVKRGKDVNKLLKILNTIVENANNGISHNSLLPRQYSLHRLSGKYKDYWECHIEPDWLLIYYLNDEIIRLERTGTHSDIF